MKTSAQLSIIRKNTFDGTEYKTATFLNKQFPVHFHHDWSIALIEAGSELVKIHDQTLHLHSDVLIVIAPHVPHAHSGTEDAFWKYKALYINPDVVQFIIKSAKIDYGHLSHIPFILSDDPVLVQKFKDIAVSLHQSNDFETNLAELFKQLIDSFLIQEKQVKNPKISIDYLENLKCELEQNFCDKILLEDLSARHQTNRFNLMRQFKKYTGLTPNEYILSLRIEHSKKIIFQNLPLVNVALESGFYDQSHFSHCFKKFVGLSPNEYRKVCNILQD
jgi:AraC-like DNA-binding protein